MSEHPLAERFLPSGFSGWKWLFYVWVACLLLQQLAGFLGFPDLVLAVLAISGLLTFADAVRCWRLGVPTASELGRWANNAGSHIGVRIVYEELRQTDAMKRYDPNRPDLDSDGVSSDDDEYFRRLHDRETHGDDRRDLLHFLYLTWPPRNRIERQLEKDDKLEEFRTDKLRSRLMREVDPRSAQGHFWRMEREIEDQGARLWTFE